MNFSIEKIEEKMLACGVKISTSASSSFDDVQNVSKKFESVRKQLQYVKKPVYTVIATKENELFMGNLVSMKNKYMACLEIHKDQLVCKVEIKSGTSATLPLKVARIRKEFYLNWLPKSGYVSSDIKDMEVYHYRQRWFRKSYKMVMELWFFVEKKG